MTLRRFVAWLVKKRLCRLRCLVLYAVLTLSCVCLRYLVVDVVPTSDDEPSVHYFDGDSSYFYIRDAELQRPSSDGENDVIVFSVYYDQRPATTGHSLIRIFARAHSTTGPVFCCFQVVGYDTWICSKRTAARKILSPRDGSTGEPAGPAPTTTTYEVMLSCSVKDADFGGLQLMKMILVGIRNDVGTRLSDSHRISRVASTDGATNRTAFSVCVLPGAARRQHSRLFSTNQDLVEYFELLKLLGTERVVSYYDDDDVVTSVLRQIKGIWREFVTWPPNVTLSSTLARNDCLYRAMNAADHVIFLDVNEVLVPNGARDWSGMVASLRRVHNTTKVGAYVLQVFNFFDETTNSTASDGAIGKRSVRRTAPKRDGWQLRHLPRVVRFRTREKKATADSVLLGQPAKIDHVTGTGSIKMLPGFINVNVPVQYAAVHRFIHGRQIYRGLTVDATKDVFVPLLMRRLYSLGNLVH